MPTFYIKWIKKSINVVLFFLYFKLHFYKKKQLLKCINKLVVNPMRQDFMRTSQNSYIYIWEAEKKGFFFMAVLFWPLPPSPLLRANNRQTDKWICITNSDNNNINDNNNCINFDKDIFTTRRIRFGNKYHEIMIVQFWIIKFVNDWRKLPEKKIRQQRIRKSAKLY